MTDKKRKTSTWVSLFNLFSNSYLAAQKHQSEIDRLALLNRQRTEDIILKKQRQREMEQKIIRLQNEIVLQELKIEMMRSAAGLGPAFMPDSYDPLEQS